MYAIDHQSNTSGSMDHHILDISNYDHADINRSSSIIVFLCGYIISCTMDPIDHESNTSGSMDHHRWEISKYDHADLNRLL